MSAATTDDTCDVVCLGESLVAFRPVRPGPLADVPAFERGIGGAESNVACALARCGHRTRWIGRVGTDGFGTHLVDAIAAHGVDVSAVQRDPDRPTGIYFRTAGERATTPAVDRSPSAPPSAPLSEPLSEVAYYRAGSAASAMSPALVPREAAWSGRILHLTGITAALSAECRDLLRHLTAPVPGRPLLSFDVNYRAALWRNSPDGPSALKDLARRCDLVFVGEDEAEAAWGLRGAAAVRAALPEPGLLVVKHGAQGATAIARDGEALTIPAPAVDVVAPVGAGDAFAAGFLSATLRGLPLPARLRHGHLTAAAALTVPGDLGEPPARERADRLAALDDTAWNALRIDRETNRDTESTA
ncbi:sugar kinase [Streptoverticillium reticulum]|uniref:sugar kinase n=1 Tax=Streptoverticillium reticulum TaxID=1433415 RepID=UPI0039BF5023